MTLYDDLGLNKNASKEDIKKAYKDKAKKYHPDKGGDKDKFAMILKAYDVLKDDEKRSYYDEYGQEQPKINIKEQKAITIITQIIEGILDTDERDIIYTDIIGIAKTFLSEKRNTFKKMNEKLNFDLKQLEKLKKIFTKRLKHKKKVTQTNLFLSVIDNKIRLLEKNKKDVEFELEILKIASKMINDFNFKFDTREQSNDITNSNDKAHFYTIISR